MSLNVPLHRLIGAARRRAAVVTVVAATALLLLVSGLSAAPASADDDVILPTRVGSAVERAQRALARTENSIDDRRGPAAQRSLAALVANLQRAQRAGVAQMNAVPVDPEAETTSGPDSVLAVLALEQLVVARIGSLYDGVRAKRAVTSMNRAARVAAVLRTGMLNAVIALDPEGAGADYADGMADTVDGYADEVASLQEALATDRLTPLARKALTTAVSRSLAAQAAVTAAFGGGE